MLRIELVKDFGKPAETVYANQIVVRHENGTPVLVCAVSAQMENGDVVDVSHCKDVDFTETLRRLGIRDEVTVSPWKGR